MWHRWIFEDYYRTHMLPLEKYGIKIHHDDVHEAWKRITEKMYVHTVGQFFAVGWPVNFWRIEAQTEKDFEWFEHKYPGWPPSLVSSEVVREAYKPGQKVVTFNEEVGYVYPHRCWSCLVPC